MRGHMAHLMCPGFAPAAQLGLPLSIRQKWGAQQLHPIALPFLGVEAATCLFQFPTGVTWVTINYSVLEIGGKKIILPFPARTSPRASLWWLSA